MVRIPQWLRQIKPGPGWNGHPLEPPVPEGRWKERLAAFFLGVLLAAGLFWCYVILAVPRVPMNDSERVRSSFAALSPADRAAFRRRDLAYAKIPPLVQRQRDHRLALERARIAHDKAPASTQASARYRRAERSYRRTTRELEAARHRYQLAERATLAADDRWSRASRAIQSRFDADDRRKQAETWRRRIALVAMSWIVAGVNRLSRRKRPRLAGALVWAAAILTAILIGDMLGANESFFAIAGAVVFAAIFSIGFILSQLALGLREFRYRRRRA